MGQPRRALISVSNKAGVVDFGKGLVARGFELLSTGGTARALRDAGVPVTAVSDYTGAPEILAGRVKTLHPTIHAGILARRDQLDELAERSIEPIEIVAVNLYPFEETIASGTATVAGALEQMDIGGPTMVRAAAKNHDRVTVIVDPGEYDAVLAELDGGDVGATTRRELAVRAIAHTAAYDAAIVNYLSAVPNETPADAVPELEATPRIRGEVLHRHAVLRYGENPHQKAALYRDGSGHGIAYADVLQGKALSYNNYLDIDAAARCVAEFSEPAVAIIKHSNPCGVAQSTNGVGQAYDLARQTDPTSSFGGIVAVNAEVDIDLANRLAETFLECVVAPGFSAEARERLAKKKKLRLLVSGLDRRERMTQRTISGGILVQDFDAPLWETFEVVSSKQPTGEQRAALEFAWRVAKHVRSNAIVFAHRERTAAIGAGQMSRIDSVKLCQLKATGPLAGTCVASDAFFPFRDGVDAIADAGATAVIQPGGSIRDEEVIAAANERDMVMVLSRMRHFCH